MSLWWIKHDEARSRVLFLCTKRGKMPSTMTFQWTNVVKCPVTFCMLFPHRIQQVPFLLFLSLLVYSESASAKDPWKLEPAVPQWQVGTIWQRGREKIRFLCCSWWVWKWEQVCMPELQQQEVTPGLKSTEKNRTAAGKAKIHKNAQKIQTITMTYL